jgi:hypothetical protein
VSDAKQRYWRDGLEASLQDVGKLHLFTSEELDTISSNLGYGYEMWGECSGSYAIPNPLEQPLAESQAKLASELRKVTCRECNGRGSITESFGPISRSSTSRCDKCNGEGRHLP